MDDRKSLSAWSTFRRATGYLKAHWVSFLAALASAAVVATCANANGLALQLLYDYVLRPEALDSLNLKMAFLLPKDFSWLKFTLTFIVSIYVVKGIFCFTSRYLMFRVGHTITYRLRRNMFGHLEKLSLQFFHQNKTGQLISRFANDVQVVQNAMIIFNHAITDMLHVVIALLILFWLQWRLTLLTFLLLPVLGMLVTKFSNRLRKWGKLMQTRIGDITSRLQETLLGIREVQAFCAEKREFDAFDAVNRDNLRVNMKATKYVALTNPVVETFLASGMCVVIWYGSSLVLKGQLTAGQLINFLTVLGMLFQPIRKLTDVNNLFKQSLGAFERIFAILDEPITIRNCENPIRLVDPRGKVEFDDVTFHYEAEADFHIENLKLQVDPGQMVAFVGPSGAGKSTLVNLIPRFYDPQGGAIRIDGADIRTIDLAQLRSLFGIVPQETILFSGTLGENVAYGRPGASEEEIWQAVADANASDFVKKLPEGLHTKIGERGLRLSGGQRQRIAIARAVLKDPRILILDEATSSLDTESEQLVQEALERLMEGRTTFVIAHRLSTVVGANLIVVLEKGRIVEMGNHEQLLSRRGLYTKLCEAQFKAS